MIAGRHVARVNPLDATFLQRFEIDDDTVEQLRSDDMALLKFGFRWLRYAMFGEPIMKTREGASEARR